jgi:tetratricopeptide (TPR) repeat protein
MTHHPRSLLRRCRPALTALALACAGVGGQAAQAAPLDDIRRQVEASQFEAAYATALANPQLIGDVHFDFLYGVAAINVGRVPEGLLALERHLAAVPANDRARLELARGYFLLGEYARARSEFELVLRFNPPAGVRANINGFLQAMQTRESVDRRSTARLYLEVGGGHDSNVNLGTFQSEVNTPFGLIQPPPTSRQIADDFGQVAMGLLQTWRVSNRLSVFAGADLDQRSNAEQRAFDIGSASGYVGLQNLAASALWRTTLGGSVQTVGANRYRHTVQVGTDASFTLGPTLQATAFGQYGEQRFLGADAVRDSQNTTLGGNVNWSPANWPWQPVFSTRLSFTVEDNNDERRTDLSKHQPLLRVSASVTPVPQVRLALGATAYQQSYRGIDIGFGSKRRDDTAGIDGAITWAMNANWSLRCDGSWTVTRSNQDLYDNARKALSLKLRYQL